MYRDNLARFTIIILVMCLISSLFIKFMGTDKIDTMNSDTVALDGIIASVGGRAVTGEMGNSKGGDFQAACSFTPFETNFETPSNLWWILIFGGTALGWFYVRPKFIK